MNRESINIKRKPVNMEDIPKISGYYMLGKPDDKYDALISRTKADKKLRVLWCPYCWRYSIWEYNDDRGAFMCGSEKCKVTTNDYHVRTENNMWFDDIPFADMKKMDVGLLKPTNWKSRRNKL